jgi:hypothetical protein
MTCRGFPLFNDSIHISVLDDDDLSEILRTKPLSPSTSAVPRAASSSELLALPYPLPFPTADSYPKIKKKNIIETFPTHKIFLKPQKIVVVFLKYFHFLRSRHARIRSDSGTVTGLENVGTPRSQTFETRSLSDASQQYQLWSN